MERRLPGRSGCAVSQAAVSQAGQIHYAGLSDPYRKRGPGQRGRPVPGGRL